MDLNKRNLQKILGIIAFAILFYWGMQNIDRVLGILGVAVGLAAPFLIGLCIAFMLNVPMRFIERHLFPKSKSKLARALRRPASLCLAILLVLAILAVVLLTIIPEMTNSIMSLRGVIPQFAANVEALADELSAYIPALNDWIDSLELDWKAIQNTMFGFLRTGAGTLLGTAFNAAASIFSGLFTGFLGIIFAVYILLQKEKLGRQIRRVARAFLGERFAESAASVAALADKTFSRFLSGQCIEAVILGAMFFVALSVGRFPYALMISVLIGFTALIPVFGAFIGFFIGAFLILMIDPMRALWFTVLFLVLQQIEGNLIYPRVVGGSIGLPAIWVLVAVTVGGSMMGVIGMLVFIPLCSVLYTLLRGAVDARLRGKNP